MVPKSGKSSQRRRQTRGKRNAGTGEVAPLAAVDLGATSVRMVIAQAGPRQKLQVLESLVHPVNLGRDTFQKGYVSAASIKALCQVLQNFQRVMAEYGVKSCRVVATSAIREASNRDLVVDRVQHETGLRVEILDAVEVSRMLFQVSIPILRQWKASQQKHTLVLDVGGGTTEIMLVRRTNLVFASTRRMGTQRLFQIAGPGEGEDARRLMENAIQNMVSSLAVNFQPFNITRCLLINTVLYKAFQQIEEVDFYEGGAVISTAGIDALLEETETLNRDEILKRFNLQAYEADLFWPALKMVQVFLETTGARAVMAADVDTIQGVLQDMLLHSAGRDPIQAFRPQIIRSAVGLGARFHFDLRHARNVARLSLKLFDFLQDFMGLTALDGLYLEVAAILHDIGMFVSAASHHKHSEYLIAWADIVGLNPRERTLVSQIARYHRRAAPQSTHPIFSSLPENERIKVNKLAAILRLADALDRSRESGIREIRCHLEEDRLRIGCDTDEDLLVESAAIRDKSTMFSEITGLGVELYRLPAV